MTRRFLLLFSVAGLVAASLLISVGPHATPCANAESTLPTCSAQLQELQGKTDLYQAAYLELQQAAEQVVATGGKDAATSDAARRRLALALESTRTKLKSLEQLQSGSDREVIGAAQLQTLSAAMKAAIGSDERATLAAEAAKHSYFRVAQVISLMQTADFDRTKVEIAKVLYPRVVDAAAWVKVYEVLDFDSSREALKAALRQPAVPVSQDAGAPEAAPEKASE